MSRNLTITASAVSLVLALGQSLPTLGRPSVQGSQTREEKRAAAYKLYQDAKNVGEADPEERIRSSIGKMLQAISLYEGAEDFDWVAQLRIETGWLYAYIADYAQALNNYQQAQKMFHRSTDAHLRAAGQAVALNSAGWIYGYMGNYDESLKYYFKAEPLYESIDDPSGEAITFGSIGSVYSSMGKYDDALDYLQRALSIHQRLDQEFAQTVDYLEIGKALRRLEKRERAISYLKEALAIMARYSETRHTVHTLNELGECYRELKMQKEALEYFNQALSHARKFDDSHEVGITLSNLMELWMNASQPNLAILYGKEAVNDFQDFRAKSKKLDKDLQASYLALVSSTYKKLAELLISKGRVSEAEQVLGMLKEEEYFDYIRRDDKVARELLAKLSLSPVEQEAFKRYDAFADNLTKLGSEYGELEAESKRYEAGKFPKKARLDELEKQIADANSVFNAFLDELKAKFGENDKRVAAVDSDTQALLKELRQPRTVVISTIVGEDHLNLIVTTGDAQRAHTVDIKAADLNKLVVEFRAAVKNSAVDPRSLGKKLHVLLFPAALQKDLDNVKADTLVWSLDGILRYAPIAALWDGNQYLAERYASVVITLASRDKLNQTPADRVQWQALGVGVSKKFAGFDALSAVPEELCWIINDPRARCQTVGVDKHVGVIPGRSLLDEDFSLQAFKDNLGRYPVVHVASHFSLNPGNEVNSYLLLGGGPDAERKLTLNRLRNEFTTKFVGVELLTLSACNTAMTAGDKSNGVEIEGFGTLAQKQGARSVLATLWSVADPSTRDLMAEFYRLLEANKKLSKAEALRKAQFALLRGELKVRGEVTRRAEIVGGGGAANGTAALPRFAPDPQRPFAHPYYWAPFILIGNWR